MNDEQNVDRLLASVINEHQIRDSRFPIMKRASVWIGSAVLFSVDMFASTYTKSIDRDSIDIRTRSKVGCAVLASAGTAVGCAVIGPQMAGYVVDGYNNFIEGFQQISH